MMRTGALALWALLLAGGVAFAQPSALTTRAHRVDAAPRVDGRLDEAVWREAAPVTRFVQHEPTPGAPATEATEVRVLVTVDALYVGVELFDRNPSAIIARDMRPDASTADVDSITLLFDTFDDDRNAYFFGLTAAGGKVDAIIGDEGRVLNFAWTGVWAGEARITDRGWVAEFGIPLATLRFLEGSERWGFNVRRMIRHKNEQVSWAPIPIEADLFRVSYYGTLDGLGGIAPGSGLAVKPVVVAAAATGDARVPRPLDPSLELQWRAGRSASVDVTVNTDFAETEADAVQANFSRFALFFPERREFFLESAGLFEFAPREVDDPPLVTPFFSRRIGLDADGARVPTVAGGRLTGRVDRWELGALHMRTGGDEDVGWTAARARRRVGTRSAVGALFTHRTGAGTPGRLTAGFDLDWRPTSTLSLSAFSLASTGAGPSAYASGALVLHHGPRWLWRGGVTDVPADLDPAIGFVRRSGVRHWEGRIRREVRPAASPIRFWRGFVDVSAFDDRQGRLESASVQVQPFWVRFQSEDELAIVSRFEYEALAAPLDLGPRNRVAPGIYRFSTFGVAGSTNSSRPATVGGEIIHGRFYDGTRSAGSGWMAFRLGRYVQTNTSVDVTRIRAGGAPFWSVIARQWWSLALTPDLLLEGLAQRAAFGGGIGLNARLRWRYRPGADVFVVINRAAPAGGRAAGVSAALKLTYLFQG